ncbi:septum formation family protein [Nocardioides sp. Leaf285]|uniref:septum formation family protein n=1 Tax=Nocardioides sp. Leaf285 TaxID=1736322 RepID=UPI000AC1CFB1|nr:septum formation family protein [Nocardioides sp. Leaf285]
MTRARRLRTRLGALALVLPLLAACSGGSGEPQPSSSSTPSGSGSASVSPTPTAPPTAEPVARPAEGACYRLSYAAALAPTVDARPVDCGDDTARTFAVGTVDALAGGHLLAIDSDRVQAAVARTCPERLAGFLGGTQADRRLSMLRAVWFTPTVEESDAGADWYRCDVIALAADERLAPLTGVLAGVLDTEAGRARYGVCGTAEPGTAGFSRVVCSRPHSWRAISVVDLGTGAYPGVDTVRTRGEAPCEDAGRDAAADPLSFRWGYEWPTAEQWADGQTYGLCWVPD